MIILILCSKYEENHWHTKKIKMEFSLFSLVIAVNRVFWIVVRMVYVTIVKKRCDAGVLLAEAEINAKTVRQILKFHLNLHLHLHLWFGRYLHFKISECTHTTFNRIAIYTIYSGQAIVKRIIWMHRSCHGELFNTMRFNATKPCT